MRKLVMMVMVSLFLVGTGSAAHAITLLPNFTSNALFGGYGAGGVGSPYLTTGALDYYVPDISLTGAITQSVYQNDKGLLFVFDLSNTSASGSKADVTSLNTAYFAGFNIAVGYDGLGQAPDSVNLNGGTVTFIWDQAGLTQGQNSPRLFIQSDAPYAIPGTFTLQGTKASTNAAAQSFDGWSPTAVPEPATASLLGMGLFGLLGFRRKRTV